MAEEAETPILPRREISPSALGDLNFDIEEVYMQFYFLI